MRASFWLSHLGDPRRRRAVSRGLFVLSLAGFVVTMLVLGATGSGTDRWFFVLTIWLVLFFLPLWLLLAAFEALGPALRTRMVGRLVNRPDRYATPAGTSLMVDDLFSRRVVLPRIATPHQAQKAREAAAAIVVQSKRAPAALDALQETATRCVVGVDAWTQDLSRWAAGTAAENIQARWGAVRALVALATLSKTLLAVYEDWAGHSAWPGLDGRSLHAFLDTVLDYCDDVALQVEILPWQEAPLDLPADPAETRRLREAWQAYADLPAPAPAALEAFLAVAAPT